MRSNNRRYYQQTRDLITLYPKLQANETLGGGPYQTELVRLAKWLVGRLAHNLRVLSAGIYGIDRLDVGIDEAAVDGRVLPVGAGDANDHQN